MIVTRRAAHVAFGTVHGLRRRLRRRGRLPVTFRGLLFALQLDRFELLQVRGTFVLVVTVVRTFRARRGPRAGARGCAGKRRAA